MSALDESIAELQRALEADGAREKAFDLVDVLFRTRWAAFKALEVGLPPSAWMSMCELARQEMEKAVATTTAAFEGKAAAPPAPGAAP
jgi:hypothetical protein